MDSRLRVLLADGNKDFRFMLQSRLERLDFLHLVGTARSHKEAGRMLQQLHPDVLIFDNVMDGVCDFELMQYIREADPLRRILVIMLPTFCGDRTLLESRYMGINLVLPKPVDIDVLTGYLERYFHSTARELLQAERAQNHDRARASKALIKMGFKSSNLGFQMVREAVLLVLWQPDRISSLTKGIYPMVAERFASNVRCVERDIRSAIAKAWSRMTPEQKGRYVHSGVQKPPSNAVFIDCLAAALRTGDEFGMEEKHDEVYSQRSVFQRNGCRTGGEQSCLGADQGRLSWESSGHHETGPGDGCG